MPAGTGIRRVAPVRCLHVDLVEEVPMLTGKEQLVARMRSLITSNSPLSLSDTEREEVSRWCLYYCPEIGGGGGGGGMSVLVVHEDRVQNCSVIL